MVWPGVVRVMVSSIMCENMVCEIWRQDGRTMVPSMRSSEEDLI